MDSDGSLNKKSSNSNKKNGDGKKNIDSHLRARQVWRFRQHLLATNPESPKLAVINDVDDGYQYLAFLGWKEPALAPDNEQWPSGWNDRPDTLGTFGTWIKVTFVEWQQKWADEALSATGSSSVMKAALAAVVPVASDPNQSCPGESGLGDGDEYAGSVATTTSAEAGTVARSILGSQSQEREDADDEVEREASRREVEAASSSQHHHGIQRAKDVHTE
ncbi:uncharacterized protein LY79DRAFT_572397 [Colletotrichum navitas]|uniref:Uncharacterized protein n=1 Tax=Colletotrichum navitas TaxID=681940 RepID=A0AAD8PK07_9PEZI|nr:uncharacterized protein LY79DRAFT_572397 [Colletotrichum navitas]KAK1566250.1 hypothetical protein LY79DRAFT_572397 [Colletotrichum navitas]